MNRKVIVVLLVIGVAFAGCVAATQINAERQAPATPEVLGLKTVADVPLNGGTTRLDYQSIDPDAGRLYIAHLGSNLITVFDLKSLQVIKDIPNISQAHGVLAIPALHRVYATATGDNQVAVIDSQSLEVLRRVPAGVYPDGLAYDPQTKKVFVSDESGKTVSVINTENDTPVGSIDMGGEVGNTQYDPVSRRIYAADQTHNQLVAIDPTSDTVIERNDLPGCGGAHGFYIDASTHYALLTCEGNAKLVVFDLSNKKIIATDTVGQTPDVVAFDQGLRRLYIASESGVLSIFSVDKDAVRKIAEAFLANNAHTVSVDQATHRIFLPLENVDGHPVLRIMEPMQAEASVQVPTQSETAAQQPMQTDVATQESMQASAGTQTPQAISTQQTAAIDWKQVDQAMGKAGVMQPGDVYRFTFPRSDLQVTARGVQLKAGFALGSHLEMKQAGNEVVYMGDFVLTEDEVNPVMDKLQQGGVEVSALHNHLLGETPRVMYLHVGGHGDPVKIAQAIHDALQQSKTPFTAPASAAQPGQIDLDTKQLDQILGYAGKNDGGIYKFTIPRAEKIMEHGTEMPPAMGVATAINFQPLGGGKAAITGDFVLLGSEANAVARALRANGIQVTALHSHALDDEPRLFYMHFWANDDALKLARGLRAAVDQTHSAKPAGQ